MSIKALGRYYALIQLKNGWRDMMNRKRILYIFSGTILLCIIAGIFYYSTFLQPKIVFSAEVSNVSNEDYERILDNEQVKYPNKNIEKFKHINIEVKVVEPMGWKSNIKIQRDMLEQYLDNNEKIQILGGGSFEHGNGKEYADSIEIYLVDISDSELRNILKDFRYKVTWIDFMDKPNSKIFYLKDYLR